MESTSTQIQDHFEQLASGKRQELIALYNLVSEELPIATQSFFDGRNEEGKVVTHPTIGFGETMLHYANGKKREIFRIGICATASGLSIHILGITDKTFLKNFLGDRLGKVKITSYCIQFKKMKDIDLEVLKSLLRLIRDPEKS
jgi:hypothetical protein